ncbi:8476_t:CDS:2, partial [Acaulospora morrowiae]
MVRKDKKNRTCDRCSKTVATPQKLREHLERRNPCQLINQIPKIVSKTRQVTEANNYNVHQALPVVNNNESEIKGLNDRLPAECKSLYDELLQMDDEAYEDIEPIKRTKEKHEFFGEVEEETDRKVVIKPTKNMITGDNERDILFREQNMGPALKRRAVAVHIAK